MMSTGSIQSSSVSGGRNRQQHQKTSAKVKACTPCRQQKLKCDAMKMPARTCTRCIKGGIPCYFSSQFERKKARSKAALQQEIELLRGRDTIPEAQTDAVIPTQLIESPQTTFHEQFETSRSQAQVSEIQSVTRHWSINGMDVDAYKVNGCFSLFFEHYLPVLPIFNSSLSPSECYKQSPLVFWCIVVTGSRRYELDPTILDRLSPRVSQLALESLGQMSTYLSTICGLLILCVWPLPMKSICEDTSLMYCGAAMQLALQHELHTYKQSSRHTRPSYIAETTHDVSKSRVWAYLKFVCHCTSLTMGSPPHLFTDSFDLRQSEEETTKSMPSGLIWMQKFDRLCTRATITLTDASYPAQTSSVGDTLYGLVKHFDEEVLELAKVALTALSARPPDTSESPALPSPPYPNPLIVSVFRIHILSFYFLGAESCLRVPGLIELYDLACLWAQQAVDKDSSTGWALYSSESYFRHMLLVAAIVLRVTNSQSLKTKVNLQRGERAFFNCVRLLRRRSLQNSDLNANIASLLMDLWHKPQCFMRPDGSYDSLTVRVRDRGAMSIVYDCLWPCSNATQQILSNDSRLNALESCIFSKRLDRQATDGGDSLETDLLHAPPPGPLSITEPDLPVFVDTSSLELPWDDMSWSQDSYFWM